MRQGHMYMTRTCPYIKRTNKLTKNKPTGIQFRIKTGLKLPLSCFTKETQFFKELTSPHWLRGKPSRKSASSSVTKDWGILSQALTTEFCILSWQQEGLREDVKSLESMCMLHSNDVFVQTVLPG